MLRLPADTLGQMRELRRFVADLWPLWTRVGLKQSIKTGFMIINRQMTPGASLESPGISFGTGGQGGRTRLKEKCDPTAFAMVRKLKILYLGSYTIAASGCPVQPLSSRVSMAPLLTNKQVWTFLHIYVSCIDFWFKRLKLGSFTISWLHYSTRKKVIISLKMTE